MRVEHAEDATYWAATNCSTTELTPHIYILCESETAIQKNQALGGTRTPNPQIRSLVRYPLRH